MIIKMIHTAAVVTIAVLAGVLIIQNYWPTGENSSEVFLFEQFRTGDDIIVISNPADDNRTAWVLNERTSQVTALPCTYLQYGDGGGGTVCRSEIEKGEVYFSDCSLMGIKARGSSLGEQDNLADYTPTRSACFQRQKELATFEAEFEERLKQDPG